MDISPQTIRQVEFRDKKLGGYHPDDVDEFLEQVASGLEILQERLRLATDRAVRAESAAGESREDDESLRKTLILAQRTADLAVQEGREQAARILESAEIDAAAMTAAAEEEARRLLDEANTQLRTDVTRLETTRRQLDEDVDRLVRYVDEQRARVKAVFSDAIANLDAALMLPERPVLSSGTVHDATYASEPPPGDQRSATFDRDLLSDFVDRSPEDNDSPGWAGSQHQP
ncbi:MAG TPA: DivIVA domain-containing protein [Acidimicrobiales bacterium]|nr:DivIVA domain-containing protein [Acidimicrobiales bacterium]